METLTWQQVAAYRRERHALLDRAPQARLVPVASDIAGVHAQLMVAAEVGLGARVEGITAPDVQAALWVQRTLVKTWAMRGTLHLLPADELPVYVAAARASRMYLFERPVWLRAFQVSRQELDSVIHGVYTALDGCVLTREQLADRVAEITGIPHLAERQRSGWVSFLKPCAYHGYLCFGPSQGTNVTFARPDQWLSGWRDVDSDEALRHVLRAFLAAYGPATREEFARWWGYEASKTRPLFKALADELVEVSIEGQKAWALGVSLMRLKDLPPPDTVRLLPNFDTYVIASYRQSALLDPAHKDRVYQGKNAWFHPTVMADGRLVGVWTYDRKKTRVEVTVELFEAATPRLIRGLEAEAERLGQFWGAPVSLSLSAG